MAKKGRYLLLDERLYHNKSYALDVISRPLGDFDLHRINADGHFSAYQIIKLRLNRDLNACDCRRWPLKGVAVDISVAICTRNRAASLARTLESLTAMRVPDGLQWEVIVVNNGSQDNTDAVIARFEGKLPIRREFQPIPGASNARNHAVAVAQGAYLLWTDDDAMVDPEWIEAYLGAFRQWPSAAIFGGKIIPSFEEPMPQWLRDCWRTTVDSAYAYRDFGDSPFPLTLKGYRIPYGANFAVRTADQRTYLYDPALGPGAWVPGEETGVIERMLKDGKTGYWVPGSKVLHCTPHARQTMAYFYGFYRRIGRAEAQQDSLYTPYRGPRFLGAPRWLWRRLFKNYCQYRLCRWTSPSSVWMNHFVRCALDSGRIEFFRKSHQHELPTGASPHRQ